jgi:prolipoprotein diacylglyceryltransferase
MITNLIYLISVVCAIWVIFDVWTNNKKMKQSMKIVWTVCAVFFGIITAAVYYFIGRK